MPCQMSPSHGPFDTLSFSPDYSTGICCSSRPMCVLFLGPIIGCKVRDEASWYKTNPIILDQNPTRLERKLRLTIISLQQETCHCVFRRPMCPGHEILCEIRHALLNLQLPWKARDALVSVSPTCQLFYSKRRGIDFSLNETVEKQKQGKSRLVLHRPPLSMDNPNPAWRV